jgi:hypothetical protein
LTEALLLIVLLLLAGSILQTLSLERRLRRLERHITSLSQRFFALSLWSEALEKRLAGQPWPGQSGIAPAQEPAALAPVAVEPAALAPEPVRPLDTALDTAVRPAAGAWKRIERLLVENWSGLLGVLVVVAGVTFITINAGLRLEARERFLVVLLAGGLLALPSLLWGRRERWRYLTDNLRSGGGALVLFACAAAGGLPQLGLQWLEAPAQALALLAAGVAINLALAAIARTATVASLHVAVSLVPLAIAPLGGPALALATAIALVGSELPLRHRWERHRLVVSWVYGLFQVAWFVSNGPELAVSSVLTSGAALAAVLVFGLGVLRLHRPGAVPRQLQALPVALLLSLWGGLGLALLFYPRGAAARAAALGMAAGLALLLGRGARRRGPRWLALGDGLVGQTLVLASLLSLAPLIADGPLLAGVVLLECLLFLALAVREGSEPLRRIGWWLSVAAGHLLAITGLVAALLTGDPVVQLQAGAVLTGGAALTAAMQVLLQRRRVPLPLPPLLGWLAGGLLAVGPALVVPGDWRSPLSLVVMGAFLVAARRWRPPGLLLGVSVAIGAAHGFGWLSLLAQAPWPAMALLGRLLPLGLLALLLMLSGVEPPSSALASACWALMRGSGPCGCLNRSPPCCRVWPGCYWPRRPWRPPSGCGGRPCGWAWCFPWCIWPVSASAIWW